MLNAPEVPASIDAAVAESRAATDSTTKQTAETTGRKPVISVVKNGCQVDAFANPRSGGSVDYRFTVRRNYQRQGTEKTGYAFRYEDLNSLMQAITEAGEQVVAYELARKDKRPAKAN